MKERTKQILRYVACGLGGLALGIGLLGGLSMCATSGNKQTEDVNTILSTERTRHNEKTTTANGGYDKYTFNVPSDYSSQSENWVYTKLYNVNASTYTLSWGATHRSTIENGFYYICEYIQGRLEAYTPSDQTYQFLVIEGHSNTSIGGITNWAYFSFLCTDNYTNNPMSFVLTNANFLYTCGIKNSTNITARTIEEPIVLNYETSSYFCLFDSANSHSQVNRYYFQDVQSYYKELGYTAGYSEGYEEGDQEGYDNGYQDGNEHGQAQGYEDGYNDGLTDGLEYGQEFTTYQIMTQDNNGGTYWPSYGWNINNNAPAGMYGDFSSSTYRIANLLQYKTEDNDLHLIYLMCPIEGAITGNEYFGHTYIYQYNQTDSTLEDTVAYGLMYYQTAANHYGWDYAHIYWTSGGTRTIDYGKVTGIYNDSLRKGYIQLSGQITDQTVYDTGYQAGLLAGQENSNMNNVFSLFTGAFDACASFFNLRIFGFLPLYWFFLAPLFIALITLLLRMVKH